MPAGAAGTTLAPPAVVISGAMARDPGLERPGST